MTIVIFYDEAQCSNGSASQVMASHGDSASYGEMPVIIEGDVERLPMTALDTTDLQAYDAVFLWGKVSADRGTELSKPQVKALWKYVEQGGLCYAEMIDAYDFPTSRLLGWKQDYPRSARTSEKLRVENVQQMKGQLLEWAGPFMKGFRIFGETKLSIGRYTATHTAEKTDEDGVPGLIVHRKQRGTVITSTFPLMQNREPWSMRPTSAWHLLITEICRETGLPIRMNQPVVQLSWEISGEAINSETNGNTKIWSQQQVDQAVNWFLQSGILPAADGSQGVYENVHSVTATVTQDRRPDCHAHTALMFHLYGRWTAEPKWERLSGNIMRHVLDGGYQDLDESSLTYGFFKWYEDPEDKPEQIFTDDQSWVCLVLLYLYRMTGDELYKKRGMITAEALFRTQQEQGLRANCLSGSEIRSKGLQAGSYQREASMNPHFESIAHAAYIQAWLVSGERRFLDMAVKGSIYLLEHLEEMKWMYSRTSAYTRFLLPLARLQTMPELEQTERQNLQQGTREILAYLLGCQHASGGIEEKDNPDPDKYGKEDTGVFRQDGEGIADQLYTNNFLLVNSWEGWKCTGDNEFKQLHDDLSKFLRSIQIKSAHSRFDGGWMRAFDMNKQEYFGNNGDTGWGPYCMESGWTQAIIASGFLLKMLDASLFDLIPKEKREKR